MRDRYLRALAWLLGLANARAAVSVHRRDLYALKDRLLRRYAVPDGEDVQRIVDPCHGWGFEGCDGACCTKCRGTGIWDTRWILLERWRLADRVFHRPVGPTRPRAVDYIDGRIRHEGVSHQAAAEGALWLALLFDRALFRRLLTSSRCEVLVWPPRPLLALQWVAFGTRWRLENLRRRLSRRCNSCERRFPFDPPSELYCAPCRATWALADDDLPF